MLFTELNLECEEEDENTKQEEHQNVSINNSQV